MIATGGSTRRRGAAWFVGGAVLLASIGVGHAQTLVINEIDYDQNSGDTAEFIEIKNVSAGDIDLDGFELDFINGATTSSYRTVALPAVVLPAGEYFVVCANAANTPNCDLDAAPDTDLIQNGSPDAVALRDPTSALVDTVSYEGDVAGFTEGTGILDGPTTRDGNAEFVSVSRSPDGADSNDNSADFALVCATPGVANSTAVAACSCGNGVVDAGEQCDDGIGINGTAASCCDAGCNFVGIDTACGDGTDDDCTNPDTCDGAGTCLSNDETAGTACGDATDDECANPDTCDGAGPCLSNDEADGTACGDATDDECANPDTCSSGVCVSNDEVDGTACTDDGNDCTGDVCGSGACTHPALGAGTACGDGTDDECANPDTCDGAGTCLTNDEADGTACTDDGNDCTGDVCGSGACTHPALGAGTLCGDGTNDDCLNPDVCDGAGACLANDEADGTGCTDDGNDCTLDVCGSGACTHPALSAGVSCGDGTDDDCRNPDTCDGAGTCLSNDETDGTACTDDGVECTSDVCAAGVCEHPAIPEGDPCTDDGNDCTDDICQSGTCNHPVLDAGTACGDGTDDDCLNPDTCDGAGACLANDEADGTACTDDGNDCTGDVCGSGACTHPALGSGTACGDGTDGDCSSPDTCDGAGTCLANDEADGTACTDDGMFCTGAETCISGVCEGEGDPCTGPMESCNEADDTCSAPPCGDGVVGDGEECDDMNDVDDDGCTDCVVDDGFVCDDSEPSVCVDSCGNGTLDAGEGCEDGNTADGDGCDGSCQVEDGFDCVEDGGTGLDVCTPVCGDGIVLPGEACDDGNTAGGDGCTRCTVDSGYTCQLEPSLCVLADASDGGCGCQTGGDSSGGFALLALIALVWRRRRTRG